MCEEQNLFWLLLLFHTSFSHTFSHFFCLFLLFFSFFCFSIFILFFCDLLLYIFYIFFFFCARFIHEQTFLFSSILGMYYVCSVEIAFLSLDIYSRNGNYLKMMYNNFFYLKKSESCSIELKSIEIFHEY